MDQLGKPKEVMDMEYLSVLFTRSRRVMIDHEFNGWTNEIIELGAGAHTISLGPRLPTLRRGAVNSTAAPLGLQRLQPYPGDRALFKDESSIPPRPFSTPPHPLWVTGRHIGYKEKPLDGYSKGLSAPRKGKAARLFVLLIPPRISTTRPC
jgi:hypothetical protein